MMVVPLEKAAEFLCLADECDLEILKMVAINVAIDHIDMVSEDPKWLGMESCLISDVAVAASRRLKVLSVE